MYYCGVALSSEFGRLRPKTAPISVPQVGHDDFLSFNQSNHCFVFFLLLILSLVP